MVSSCLLVCSLPGVRRRRIGEFAHPPRLDSSPRPTGGRATRAARPRARRGHQLPGHHAATRRRDTSTSHSHTSAGQAGTRVGRRVGPPPASERDVGPEILVGRGWFPKRGHRRGKRDRGRSRSANRMGRNILFDIRELLMSSRSSLRCLFRLLVAALRVFAARVEADAHRNATNPRGHTRRWVSHAHVRRCARSLAWVLRSTSAQSSSSVGISIRVHLAARERLDTSEKRPTRAPTHTHARERRMGEEAGDWCPRALEVATVHTLACDRAQPRSEGSELEAIEPRSTAGDANGGRRGRGAVG